MTVITTTRKAKCKDCIYCTPYSKGKRKMHYCGNPRTEITKIRLNDLVCRDWKLQ